MLCLIDSNILIYALNRGSPYYKQSTSIIDKITQEEITAYITPQNLFETYAVITSSRFGTKPLSAKDAYSIIDSRYNNSLFNLAYPKSDTWSKVFDIAEKFNIIAQDIHDVHLIATMLDNGINNIVTFDKTQFAKFNLLNAFHPDEIV